MPSKNPPIPIPRRVPAAINGFGFIRILRSTDGSAISSDGKQSGPTNRSELLPPDLENDKRQNRYREIEAKVWAKNASSYLLTCVGMTQWTGKTLSIQKEQRKLKSVSHRLGIRTLIIQKSGGR